MLLLFKTVLEVVVRAIRQGKEIKGIQTRKQEFSQFSNDMTLYIETQTTIKNQFELSSEFTVFQDTRPAHKNQFYFYMHVTENIKGKFMYNSIKKDNALVEQARENLKYQLFAFSQSALINVTTTRIIPVWEGTIITLIVVFAVLSLAGAVMIVFNGLKGE